MTPDPRGYPAGIIFRRLDADLDRRQAARLLPDCALDDHDGACVWYGLCDLTAAETSGPVAVAVLRSVAPRTAQLCSLAVAAAYERRSLGPRLVGEVADRLRARGVEEISAPAPHDPRAAALLAQAGFRAERPQECGSVWLRLPL